MITIWNPDKKIMDDNEFIERIANMTYAGLSPGSKFLLDMLGSISNALLKDHHARRFPQYVSLAYWLRPASIMKLSEVILRRNQGDDLLLGPRGVALHLPPTNVDTIFVYSWAVSVIAGNANIVRLPRNCGAETEWLVGLILDVVKEYNELHRHVFCSYDYGGDLEVILSSLCDLRMIWGGDRKIKTVSRIDIRPDGLSIGFPDRKSLALIRTKSYESASEISRNQLALNLFNDIYWFDQMGCGSPRLIVWVGDAPGNLSDDLYTRLASIVTAKKYKIETGIYMNKLILGNELLAEGIASRLRNYGNELSVVDIQDPLVSLERTHGGGFLGEFIVNELIEVSMMITRKIQTIGYFGFSANELKHLASSITGRGGYRIVPIGRALHFDVVWDGVELLSHMTRKVLIETEQ